MLSIQGNPALNDSTIESLMHGGLAAVYPAAVLLVAQGGAVLLHRAYGHLDPETRQQPTRIDSLFDLASVTKLFTVTAFMPLVEAGRVALETPLAEVLPEFDGVRPITATEDPLGKTRQPPDPAFAGQEVDAGQVTFWHLLTHTSGLAAWRSLYRESENVQLPPRSVPDPFGTPGRVPLPHQIPPGVRAQRLAAIWEQYGFAYPPRRQMVYSDLGLILLGEAIARLAGVPLDLYLRQAVLKPLRLTNTAYNPLERGFAPDRIVPTEFCDWRQRRCRGEVHDENAAGLGGVAGHAGLFATAWDVAVLGQIYLRGGAAGGARILSPETVAEMTREQVNMEDNPRGLGWLLHAEVGSSAGRRFGPRSYGHTGFTGTSIWVDPDRELVVVLLTNRVYHGRDPQQILEFRPRLHDAVVEATEKAHSTHAGALQLPALEGV